MRIESLHPCVPRSCDGGPAAPETPARIRETLRVQRPDRVTLVGAGSADGPRPAPIDAAPSAAAGEPTDPEVARPASPRGSLVARYAVSPDASARPRLEVYG
jgi:hypothetical protein